MLPQLQPVDHVITDPPYDQRTHEGARSCGGDHIADQLRAPRCGRGAARHPWRSRPAATVCFCTFEMVSEYRAAIARMAGSSPATSRGAKLIRDVPPQLRAPFVRALVVGRIGDHVIPRGCVRGASR